MSKFVMIQAVPPTGFSSHGEAFRMWPGDRPIRIEVLDGEDDGPKVPVKRKVGESHVVEEQHNPTVIGQRSFRALQGNPRIRILSDGAVVAGAEIAAAKEDVARLTAEKIEVAGKNSELDAENLQLRGRIISLEEALKNATAGDDTAKTAAAVKSALEQQAKQFDASYTDVQKALKAAQDELAALKAAAPAPGSDDKTAAGNGKGKGGK